MERDGGLRGGGRDRSEGDGESGPEGQISRTLKPLSRSSRASSQSSMLWRASGRERADSAPAAAATPFS